MNRRLLLLGLSVLIVAAVVILASSLHDVHFQPGRSLPGESGPGGGSPLTVTETMSDTPLWKVLLFWLALVINMVLFFFLLPKDVRKKVLRQFISFGLSALAILIALRYRMIRLPAPNGQAANPAAPPATSGQGGMPIEPFHPPQMTPWWVYLISFAVLAAILTLLWLAYRWWTRSNRRSDSNSDLFGAIAQSSLQDLAAGRDWSDVIIQSYVRMSEAVSSRRGMQRAPAVTPSEFAARLEQAGLPALAVSRLTRLFESARYGAHASSQLEVNEAVACLNSILQACGQPQ
jgi:hypothetical protein